MPGNDIEGGFASHIVVPSQGLCPVDEARLAASGAAHTVRLDVTDADATGHDEEPAQ